LSYGAKRAAGIIPEAIHLSIMEVGNSRAMKRHTSSVRDGSFGNYRNFVHRSCGFRGTSRINSFKIRVTPWYS